MKCHYCMSTPLYFCISCKSNFCEFHQLLHNEKKRKHKITKLEQSISTKLTPATQSSNSKYFSSIPDICIKEIHSSEIKSKQVRTVLKINSNEIDESANKIPEERLLAKKNYLQASFIKIADLHFKNTDRYEYILANKYKLFLKGHIAL